MWGTAEALGVASLGACLHASSTGAIASFVACVFHLLCVQEAMNVGDGGGVGGAFLGACLHANSTGAIASFVACVFHLLCVQEAMNVGDGEEDGDGLGSGSLSDVDDLDDYISQLVGLQKCTHTHTHTHTHTCTCTCTHMHMHTHTCTHTHTHKKHVHTQEKVIISDISA